TTIQLAQRNEALEDFAALVAHELKAPLQAALISDDPSRSVESALDLVDSLLQAAQGSSEQRTFSSLADTLDQVVADLGTALELSVDAGTTVPLPSGPLRVILRNLLSNAERAGARHVRLTAIGTPRSWQLLVDDDGVGLGHGRYSSGSGLGLSL